MKEKQKRVKLPKRKAGTIPAHCRKPVEWLPPPYCQAPELLDKEQREAFEKEVAEHKTKNAFNIMVQSLRKMHDYMVNYKIPQDSPDKWFWLCHHFAHDFVDGFQPVIKGVRGRNEEWSQFLYARLYYDVQAMIKKAPTSNKATARYACEALAKTPFWKSKNVDSKALANRYISAKKSLSVQFMHSVTEMPEFSHMKDKLWDMMAKIVS